LSKERMELLREEMSCVELEIMLWTSSFRDKDNGVKVEGMFAECDSHSLIEINSSCDRKVRLFYDLIGGKTGHLYSEIIQVFDFISSESNLF
jgi:hypothetical protein